MYNILIIFHIILSQPLNNLTSLRGDLLCGIIFLEKICKN